MQLDFVNFRGTGSVRDAVPSEHSIYQVDNIRKTGPNDEYESGPLNAVPVKKSLKYSEGR